MTALPERTCIGCRAKKPKTELLRIALDSRRQATLDGDHQAPGRGAYLCRTTPVSCLAAAQRRRALLRSLRVTEAAVNYEKLLAQIQG